MSLKTRQQLVRSATPRSFAGLMALYESNFRRFVRLVPETDLPFEQARSRSPTDRDLHLRVLERCKYTTTVHLTYWFEDGAPQADPDLHIRLYRDAALAEAVHCQAQSRYTALPGLDLENERALHAQWPRNLLLNKWLAFLIQHGHGFATVGRPRQRG
ncbi:DUF1249 domain-containing protein [Spectribacter hydrogenooxidans]|uniref:DUF1249 domain-containing protein n=1 Tax=Spectribacter hydrogenoxidans TaxID=3075608 RepID=A0ABU3BXI1_9GAMM|nr:DUF1249 domain-containing protein [Salinisphaera sp. W335]MDT0634022.1 DUF1249 domain-containing protein [Salinisphaera sp. W335]